MSDKACGNDEDDGIDDTVEDGEMHDVWDGM